jgi:hypothetical protein
VLRNMSLNDEKKVRPLVKFEVRRFDVPAQVPLHFASVLRPSPIAFGTQGSPSLTFTMHDPRGGNRQNIILVVVPLAASAYLYTLPGLALSLLKSNLADTTASILQTFPGVSRIRSLQHSISSQCLHRRR